MRSEKSVLEDRAKALVVGVASEDWESVVVNTSVMACDTQIELFDKQLRFFEFSCCTTR